MWDFGLYSSVFTLINSSHISYFYCSVLVVSLVGALLAVFSEDNAAGTSRWYCIMGELLPVDSSSKYYRRYSNRIGVQASYNWRSSASFSGNASDMTSATDNGVSTCEDSQEDDDKQESVASSSGSTASKRAKPTNQQLKKLSLPQSPVGSLMRLLFRFFDNISKLIEKTMLACSYITHSHQGKSKRHIMYLLQKQQLGLEYKEDESIFQTYADCKHKMLESKSWPFMWEVQRTADLPIVCNNMKAIPMSSYSYLDLMRCPEVQGAALEAAKEWSTGHHGPRFLGGNAIIIRELEKKIAEFFGRPDSLTCSAGFMSCMSAVCAVCQPEDLIVADSRIHTSLRSGVTMSQCAHTYFKHENYADLERILKEKRHLHKECWLIIESVYSMDGDVCDLPKCHKLAKKYNCRIIVDEAHGFGVLGATGRGIEELYNLPGVCDVIVGTFSKAVAGVGGFVTAHKEIMDFMDFHTVGSIFSAPISCYTAAGVKKAIEVLDGSGRWRLEKAQQNAKIMRSLLKESLMKLPADFPEEQKYIVSGSEHSCVIPIVFQNDQNRVFKIAVALLQKGFVTSAVGYPACPLKWPRLRLTATCAYTQEVMEQFNVALVESMVACRS